MIIGVIGYVIAMSVSKKKNNNQENTKVIYTQNPSKPVTPSKMEHAPKPEPRRISKRVVNTEYINNLRVGRSWVLPQMVDMCFNGTRFSKYKYMEAVETLDYNKAWTIALRNFRVISMCQNRDDEYRSGWWTKEVAVAMAKNDLQLLKAHIAAVSRNPLENCSGGPYIRLELRGCKNKQEQMYFTGSVAPSSKWYNKGKTMDDLYRAFVARIGEIEQAQTPKQVYNALMDYDNHRCLLKQNATLSKEFRNAFMGDGAYTSMMTLVKFLNLRYKDESGNMLTREQCIEDIENKAQELAYDGEQMFAYLTAKFFDANAEGGFDITKYRQGNL